MSARLISAVDKALANEVQHVMKEASVMVQFAAGDYSEILDALAEAKLQVDASVPTPTEALPVIVPEESTAVPSADTTATTEPAECDSAAIEPVAAADPEPATAPADLTAEPSTEGSEPAAAADDAQPTEGEQHVS